MCYIELILVFYGKNHYRFGCIGPRIDLAELQREHWSKTNFVHLEQLFVHLDQLFAFYYSKNQINFEVDQQKYHFDSI